MKINRSSASSIAGSTLLMGVMVTALVSFVLVAYLGLVQSQNVSTARSQSWNSVVPIIEAGIEDALTHLNTHGSTNLLCDGWQQTGGMYCIKRDVGDGYYVAIISNWVAGSGSTPVIDSRGFVTMPQLASVTPTVILADIGAPNGSQSLARGVRCGTRCNALFAKAMVAKGQITLSGTTDTDSFNSMDPTLSTDGLYDSSKTRDNGDIATNGQLIKEISASGEVKIRGHVSTGPGGTVGFNGNAVAGSATWVNGGNTGIESGWFKDDMNVSFPDVPAPTGSFFTPAGGNVGGTNYYLLLNGGNWRPTGNLSLSGPKTVLVTGDNVLYVQGNFSLSGQSGFIIAPGASLKVYVTGSASLSGQGVMNCTGNAKNFFFYGLPSCTSVTLSGNSAFIGVIYAPNASFTMSGGGTDTVDFIGSSITKDVSMSGKYSFHYDESLAATGPTKGFTVTSWNEMTPGDAGNLPPGVASLVNH
jgi:hypothetical protein